MIESAYAGYMVEDVLHDAFIGFLWWWLWSAKLCAKEALTIWFSPLFLQAPPKNLKYCICNKILESVHELVQTLNWRGVSLHVKHYVVLCKKYIVLCPHVMPVSVVVVVFFFSFTNLIVLDITEIL